MQGLSPLEEKLLQWCQAMEYKRCAVHLRCASRKIYEKYLPCVTKQPDTCKIQSTSCQQRHKLCTWVCPTRDCSWVLFLLFSPMSVSWLLIARALALGAQLPITMIWWLLPTIIICCLPTAIVPPLIWTSPPFG